MRVASELELPVQWVWDIVDEFLYQFEGWCAYTSKVSDMTDDEIIYLKENPTIWNTVTVMTYLDYLKKRSGIVPWLEAGGERGLVPEDAPAMTVEGEMSGSSSATYRMLGYFCIIGELRLHCLFRDYHLALKSIANIDLSDSGTPPIPHPPSFSPDSPPSPKRRWLCTMTIPLMPCLKGDALLIPRLLL